MKEYCIYNIWNGGTPFISSNCKIFFECKLKLQDMVNLEEERNRPYYVDNDFWNNKYPMGIQEKYFSIRFREVSEWKKYEEYESRSKEESIDFLKYMVYK